MSTTLVVPETTELTEPETVVDWISVVLEDEISVVLEWAADYIEKNGWAQGDNGRGTNGQACALVAIWDVSLPRRHRGIHLFSEASERLFKSLDLPDEMCHRRQHPVAIWNDSRTPGEEGKQEVVRALRAAAAKGSE